MSLKLIIFDLDGTLLDTLQDLADATNEALAGFGLPALPAEEYKLMAGMGVRILMQRTSARSAASLAEGIARPSVADLDPIEMVDAFNRAYGARWSNKTRPYEGIPEMLDQLTAAGLRLAILSNKPDEFTRKVAAHYYPEGLFERIYGMRPDYPGKPDPALTLELCRQSGVHPDEAALIGDSGSDMQTAVAAGALPVGVLWGFRSADELSTSGARLLARTPAELANQLLSLI